MALPTLQPRQTNADSSERELISHVVRRLGIGANADLVADITSVQEAIDRCLVPATEDPDHDITMPRDWTEAYEDEFAPVAAISSWWIDRMADAESPIQERLTWFWHDHFAMTSDKVDVGWVLWRHLQGLRAHATGNFRDLLHEVSRSSAMLIYLDGESNDLWNFNENFGREALELYTLGVGNYTQDDVVAAARCFGANRPNYPKEIEDGTFDYDEAEGWAPMFFEEDFDSEPKTLLGQTGNFSMEEALDIMLDQPATGRFIAVKMYKELVGLAPPDDVADRLGELFASDYEIMPLVQAIINEPAFTSPDAVRAKVRTPLEKLVTMFQSFPRQEPWDIWDYYDASSRTGYGPFRAPNPAGYRKGPVLLGPSTLAASFVYLRVADEDYPPELEVAELFAKLGIFDISTRTYDGVSSDLPNQLALAYGSPEFLLT